MARRLPPTLYEDEGVAHFMRATTRYQDLANLKA